MAAYPNKKNWVIDTYRGLFLKKAEEDYVACRVLFNLNLLDLSFYHLQQCIEKYLKAFVLDKNIEIIPGKKNECKDFFKNGHKLETWAKICGRSDSFFNDGDFMDDLSKITFLETISRYPQDSIQSWGSCPIALIKFLDEFVFEMRQKITHDQYEDVIDNFLKGCISSHPKLAWDFNITSKQIKNFITFKNDFFR